jgi:hypothetical protein
MKALATLLLLIPLSCHALPATAADEPTPKAQHSSSSFRIEYVLFEVEGGKRFNERTFSLTANAGQSGQLRSGSRVPINSGEKGVVYMDVGFKISGRVSERDGDISLDTEIEISTFAIPEQAKDPKGNPVIRTINQSLSSRPELGKTLLLSTLDDLNSTKRLQVEVTVRRIR